MAVPFSAKIQGQDPSDDLFNRENLVAWCIVPFDAAERTPEQRAMMLKELGISQMAYDYRTKHIASFKEEIHILNANEIGLSAVWMWIDPRDGKVLNADCRAILDILVETGTQTELWVSFPDHFFGDLPDEEKLKKGIIAMKEVLSEAEKAGCTIALYNHGSWFGEPENQIRIIEAIGSEKIRIVYNFHHGHHQMNRFEELLDQMKPYLSAININGMRKEGPKIITLGEGDRELDMLRSIVKAGYKGPIGILGHTEGEDIRPVLERNLKGLDRLKADL
jgi:sugar phosphate isomerase/epimerase